MNASPHPFFPIERHLEGWSLFGRIGAEAGASILENPNGGLRADYRWIREGILAIRPHEGAREGAFEIARATAQSRGVELEYVDGYLMIKGDARVDHTAAPGARLSEPGAEEQWVGNEIFPEGTRGWSYEDDIQRRRKGKA
ncbi:MAG: hypothetical protein JNK60_06260 [Acidobacteria bacterium]|nr:hypothetical protein [Acidobacteriota bacterium]